MSADDDDVEYEEEEAQDDNDSGEYETDSGTRTTVESARTVELPVMVLAWWEQTANPAWADGARIDPARLVVASTAAGVAQLDIGLGLRLATRFLRITWIESKDPHAKRHLSSLHRQRKHLEAK